MKTTRIYYSDRLETGDTINLPASASHHVANVLRLPANSVITVFNGQGSEYHASITEIIKKTVVVCVGEKQTPQRESPLHITLGQGISRGERMDYALQKAVELGVDRITPLFTERCNARFDEDRLEKRMRHWRAAIISACEQSGRTRIPELDTPMTLYAWLTTQKNASCDSLCLVCTPKYGTSLSVTAPQRVTLLIGPEGGLTAGEILAANNHRFMSWRMGPRILRTETAAVVAITTAQVLWGDM